MTTLIISDELLELMRKFVEVAYGSDALAGRGEGLRHHSLATAVISTHILPQAYVLKLARSASASPEAVASALALAGLTHDWGKALLPYQEYVREGGTHAPIRHEVASFIALTSLLKPREGGEECYLALTGAVLYHHHGLYDFTEKIVKYLRGGVRAWPDTRDSKYVRDLRGRLTALLNALSTYLGRAPAGEVLTPKPSAEEVINGLTSPENPLQAVLGEVVGVEERVNQRRNLVTPPLTALMIGDNISASIARAEEREGERVLRMSEASAPVIAFRERTLAQALTWAGLSRYAANLRKAYEALRR